MSEIVGYKKFKISFHLIILVFAIGLIISSIVAYNEMDRSLLYLILGIFFATESVFVLYKSLNRKPTHK